MQVTLLVLTVTINHKIILLMMLFITFWCKRLKTDPYREICIYTTCLKPSFAKYNPNKLIYICYCYWPVWLNGWVFVYKLNGSGFESIFSHLNFRFCTCFEQGFLDIQATIECGFTLKGIRDMRRTYSQFNHALKKSDIFKMAEVIFQEVWWEPKSITICYMTMFPVL